MAGSYNHVITDAGDLYAPHQLSNMLENSGDVFEAIEEMYGMIWWLAHMAQEASIMSPDELVEHARQNYVLGLALAKQNTAKRKHRS